MSPRRLYAPVVLGILATGGLVLLATGRNWATATVASPQMPTDLVEVPGTDVAPTASALALVVVAAGLAVLASSVRLRRWVGGAVTLVSGIGVTLLLVGIGDLDGPVGSALAERPGFTGDVAYDEAWWWRWIAVAGFIAAGALGVVVARLSAAWPTMGRSYEAPSLRRSPGDSRGATSSDSGESDAAQKAPGAGRPDADDFWKALDEGRDPTQ